MSKRLHKQNEFGLSYPGMIVLAIQNSDTEIGNSFCSKACTVKDIYTFLKAHVRPIQQMTQKQWDSTERVIRHSLSQTTYFFRFHIDEEGKQKLVPSQTAGADKGSLWTIHSPSTESEEKTQKRINKVFKQERLQTFKEHLFNPDILDSMVKGEQGWNHPDGRSLGKSDAFLKLEKWLNQHNGQLQETEVLGLELNELRQERKRRGSNYEDAEDGEEDDEQVCEGEQRNTKVPRMMSQPAVETRNPPVVGNEGAFEQQSLQQTYQHAPPQQHSAPHYNNYHYNYAAPIPQPGMGSHYFLQGGHPTPAWMTQPPAVPYFSNYDRSNFPQDTVLQYAPQPQFAMPQPYFPSQNHPSQSQQSSASLTAHSLPAANPVEEPTSTTSQPTELAPAHDNQNESADIVPSSQFYETGQNEFYWKPMEQPYVQMPSSQSQQSASSLSATTEPQETPQQPEEQTTEINFVEQPLYEELNPFQYYQPGNSIDSQPIGAEREDFFAHDQGNETPFFGLIGSSAQGNEGANFNEGLQDDLLNDNFVFDDFHHL